jgi:dTDP-4-amino-4,6-dideoxygalactose transaminase
VQLAALNAAFHPAGWALATRLGALRFGESEAGLSYRVAGLPAGAAEAAIRGLMRLDAANAARRRTTGRLLAALAGVDGLILPAASPGSEPIYLRLPVLLPDERVRDALYTRLARAGMGAGRMYGRTLAELFPGLGGRYPGAEAVARRLLTLPTHAYVTATNVAQIAAVFRNTGGALVRISAR